MRTRSAATQQAVGPDSTAAVRSPSSCPTRRLTTSGQSAWGKLAAPRGANPIDAWGVRGDAGSKGWGRRSFGEMRKGREDAGELRRNDWN